VRVGERGNSVREIKPKKEDARGELELRAINRSFLMDKETVSNISDNKISELFLVWWYT
jgi:hypothetical protein